MVSQEVEKLADEIFKVDPKIVHVGLIDLEGHKTELDFSGTAEPKGISDEDLRNNFLPVFKITAEGLEKLHSN